MSTHVWLRNAETGGVWECPNDPDVLRHFEARGWEPTEAPEDPGGQGLYDLPKAAQVPDEEPHQTDFFDPTAHNAEQVSAHLALHAESDPGEVERVLDLERAGKNRKTVVVPEGFDPITGE